MSRFETEVLTQDGNVEGLGRVNATWVDRAMTHTAHRRVILDMDSSEVRYMEASRRDPSTTALWEHVLSPFVRVQPAPRGRYIARTGGGRDPILPSGVRRSADAAFAKPEGVPRGHVLYAISGNEVLQREIAPLLRRPVGRPPKRRAIRRSYRAGSWDRRVVAKVEWHRGEPFGWASRTSRRSG